MQLRLFNDFYWNTTHQHVSLVLYIYENGFQWFKMGYAAAQPANDSERRLNGATGPAESHYEMSDCHFRFVILLQCVLIPDMRAGCSLAQAITGEDVRLLRERFPGRGAFAGLSDWQAAVCVVAYEPIWAIGTSLSATAQQAGDIIRTSVRDVLAELFGHDTAQAIRIQYGGSVTVDNIADYIPCAECRWSERTIRVTGG